MTETNINALYSVEAVFDGVDIEVTVEFSAGGGTFEHDELTSESRAKADQHPISSITGLQYALDGKANSAHVHTISDVTGLQLALDGKSNVGHGHSISDINNLTQQLANAKNSSANEKLRINQHLTAKKFESIGASAILNFPINTELQVGVRIAGATPRSNIS